MALIQIKDLHKSYAKNGKVVAKALRGIDLDIEEGEILTLLGVNGAGKTTLSSIIASLHPPTSGDVLWKNKSIFKQLTHYRHFVGLCPQKPNLDKRLTLRENLYYAGLAYGLSKSQSQKRIDELLEQFNLGSYADALAVTLSGGYRQRFLIARTLMPSPKLVILDEPTIGLDPHIRKRLWETIKELKKQGTTILLTTHYLDEAEILSDRVCMIDSGAIKLIDTPDKLKDAYKQKDLESVFIHLIDKLEEQNNDHKTA